MPENNPERNEISRAELSDIANNLRVLNNSVNESGITKRGDITLRVVIVIILLFATNIATSSFVSACFTDDRHHASCKILPWYNSLERTTSGEDRN